MNNGVNTNNGNGTGTRGFRTVNVILERVLSIVQVKLKEVPLTTLLDTEAWAGAEILSAKYDTTNAVHHTVQYSFTGTPTAVELYLQGSLDGGTTWNNITGPLAVKGGSIMFVYGYCPYVRAKVVAITGGTSPTVTVKYAGRS